MSSMMVCLTSLPFEKQSNYSLSPSSNSHPSLKYMYIHSLTLTHTHRVSRVMVWWTVPVCLTDSFLAVSKYGIHAIQYLAWGTAVYCIYVCVCCWFGCLYYELLWTDRITIQPVIDDWMMIEFKWHLKEHASKLGKQTFNLVFWGVLHL